MGKFEDELERRRIIFQQAMNMSDKPSPKYSYCVISIRCTFLSILTLSFWVTYHDYSSFQHQTLLFHSFWLLTQRKRRRWQRSEHCRISIIPRSMFCLPAHMHTTSPAQSPSSTDGRYDCSLENKELSVKSIMYGPLVWYEQTVIL